jgi:hypothetical protein
MIEANVSFRRSISRDVSIQSLSWMTAAAATSVLAIRRSQAQYRELGSFDQSRLTPRLVPDYIAPVLFPAGSPAQFSNGHMVIEIQAGVGLLD